MLGAHGSPRSHLPDLDPAQFAVGGGEILGYPVSPCQENTAGAPPVLISRLSLHLNALQLLGTAHSRLEYSWGKAWAGGWSPTGWADPAPSFLWEFQEKHRRGGGSLQAGTPHTGTAIPACCRSLPHDGTLSIKIRGFAVAPGGFPDILIRCTCWVADTTVSLLFDFQI